MDKRDNAKEMDLNKGFYEDHPGCWCEASIHCYENCKKQSTHDQFIPFPNYKIHHLPQRYRKDWIYNFTVYTGNLTGRISVNLVSQRRPEYKPGTKEHYHLYEKRGSKHKRTGSGRIYKVIKQDLRKDNFKSFPYPCPCEDCKRSVREISEWGEIHLYTARHLVFDNAELNGATCRLNFDSELRFEHHDIIYGLRIISGDAENDTCSLAFFSCNMVLVNNLYEKMHKWDVLRTGLRKHFSHNPHTLKLVVIISHPHGCSKQVSIGKWTHREHVGVSSSRYFYNTPTCPGTSGACILRFDVTRRLYFDHVHCGVDEDQRNYSGVGLR